MPGEPEALPEAASTVEAGPITWRFMGSYKWVYKSPNMVIIIVTLLKTPLTTTHEPPSIDGCPVMRQLGKIPTLGTVM